MRKALGISLVLFLVAGVSFASPAKVPIPTDMPLNGSEVVSADQVAPYRPPVGNELNVVGDTLHVGYTWYDIQHNAQVGRMIGYSPEEDRVHLIYMRGFQSGSATRHMMYVQISDVSGEDPQIAVIGTDGIDNGVGRSGFGTIAYDVQNDKAFPTFHHQPNASAATRSTVALESEWIAGFFDLYTAPDPASTDNDVIFPRSVFGEGNYIHLVSSDFPPGAADATRKYYTRWLYDPASEVPMIVATATGDQVLMTAVGMNNSSDVHVSSDGSMVAYTETMPRSYTIGEDDANQWNNDLWLWESLDGGMSWADPFDITRWLPPDEQYLPGDTARANQDTMRCYMDGSVLYDFEDRLHATFTTPNYYTFEGTITYTSRIWHWERDRDEYTLIADGTEGFMGRPETFGETADRPSIYSDPDTGILWVIYRRTSNSLDNPEETDWVGTFAAGEVYLTASPPGEMNGRRWTQPINLTNTKWLSEEAMTPGDAQSEIDPSIALASHGDYLHLMYVVDTWPDRNTDTEATLCPVVYHKVSKQELIDSFTGWLPNYPMHIDSAGFWEDPNGWEWNGFFEGGSSVGEAGSLQPNQVELSQNYPNPFNPSTQISFAIGHTAKVKLAVYDVLGREVATLVNRSMSAGRHQVSFVADDLPSGVYFYTLQAGDVTQTRKMVLMK